MLKLLDRLQEYNNTTSLICFPIGMYKVQLEGFDTIHLVVLPNLARNVSQKCFKFDLKGSTNGRKVLKNKEKYDFISTLKDLDLIKLLHSRPDLLSFD
jgi:hypothetical protein